MLPGQGEHRSAIQKWRLLLGGCAGVLFSSVFSVLGAISPAYDFTHRSISNLEFEPLGSVQQINFVLFGLLQLVFAYALRIELKGGKGEVAIPAFQAICAGAVIGDGLFIHDPAHMTFDLIAFNSTMVVLLMFAWRFRGDRRWKGWSAYSVASVLGMMVGLTAFGLANAHGGPGGLFERLAVLIRTTWSVVFVVRLVLGKVAIRPVIDEGWASHAEAPRTDRFVAPHP